MSKISCARHRFPPVITQRAIWLYYRFPLSFRDVEEMLAERGIDASYETIRRWILKFGPAIATDKLGPYSTALRELGLAHLQVKDRRLYNRAEVSHQPTRRRERRMGRFKSPESMQRFLSAHDAIYNHFNLQRHLISRRTLHQTRTSAYVVWNEIVAAQSSKKSVTCACLR